MRALRYSFEEAVTSLWRGRRSGLLSTATIGVALFVLGGFLVVTTNLERLGDEWGRSAEMAVYLHDDLTEADRAAIEALLTPGALVAEREYVSKDDALKRFRTTFADLAGAVETLEGNPLPASYDVRLNAASGAQTAIADLATKLTSTAGVADVRYDRQWVDRLLSTVAIVRGAGFALGAVLTVAAALTVANVVRLALWARRDEIEIMELVGAPQAYVRGPFVMEGILQGGIGAVLALLALALTYLALRGRFLQPLADAVNLPSIQFLSVELSLGLLAGGMAVGCLGGLAAGAGLHAEGGPVASAAAAVTR
jgi:cell division transport system permease protein